MSEQNRLLRGVGEVMKDISYIIVANVIPNREVPFVHKTGWPQMIYRTPEELQQLLTSAEFTKGINLLIEPLGIHCVAIARK